ncbi:uncharacterized protein LOC128224913 isoform X2 [Mya arenaria]|uniref:uncharacterized protein LOC128224913 isoform X2 n=1 Tax=Mya arenaria TaxID=6604 RepID=UPI0022E4F113|nr:uncharacterized protein LOC128224913 isoform X2 [Mya arenaria]XP_052790973.1 uncharacterized protein LOC128224913 isoform X2 [Mya arenaria]
MSTKLDTPWYFFISNPLSRQKMATGGEHNYHQNIQNLYKECVTPVLKTLLLQRVKELKEPNQPDEKWTVNLFLHKHKRQIFPCLRNEHLEDVLYPFEEPTNMDNWDFTAYVLVLLQVCKLSENLQQDLINLDELAKKIQLNPNNKLSEGIYYAYQDRIRCRITQICQSLDDGGNSHNILSRFEEVRPLISRSKYPNGFAQKFEKDVQVVSQCDSDAITYLEWIEDRLKRIEVNPLVPELEVVVILKHYNESDEQSVSRYIETAFMEAVKKYDVAVSTSIDEKGFNPDQVDEAVFESADVMDEIQFYVKRLFEGQQRVTSVTRGCVKLKIQCETVRVVIDLFEKSINGLLTFNLATLEDKIRLIQGHELFDIYVGVTRESCWKLVNELKTVAFGGYIQGRLHEKLTINHKRIEDGQKIVIKSRPTTVTSVQDLRRIISSNERVQTCRKLSELLTRQLPLGEGTINVSLKVIPDIEVKSKYNPDFSDWKEDETLDTMADTKKNYFKSLHHVYPKRVVSELGSKSVDIINEDSSYHPLHTYPKTPLHFGSETTEISKRMHMKLPRQKDEMKQELERLAILPDTLDLELDRLLIREQTAWPYAADQDLGVKILTNPEFSSRNKHKELVKEIRAFKSKYEPDSIKLKEDKTEPTVALTLKKLGEMELLGTDGHGEFCSISGMTVVGDRFLVAADYAGNCVRCFDMDSGKQQVRWYDSKLLPCGITTIPGNRVAVTSRNEVWFLRVTEKGDLLFENKINAKERCYAIASSGDNLIVCYVFPDPGVQILDMKGNVIKKFEKDDDGEKLFKWPASLAVSPDQSIIYIADCIINTVTSLTQDGRIVGVVNVKLNQHDGSRMTVDSAGRVYVCGYDTVCLVSPETRTVIPLLGYEGGFCVALCDKTQRLYLSPLWNCNAIQVFEMPKHTTA